MGKIGGPFRSTLNFRFIPRNDFVTNGNIEGWQRPGVVFKWFVSQTSNTTVGTTTTTILKTFSLARAIGRREKEGDSETS